MLHIRRSQIVARFTVEAERTTTALMRDLGEHCLQISCSRARFFSRLARALAALTTFVITLSPSLTETAVANGDTRTIYLHHAHTGEDIAATYLVNGQYDSNVLKQLNWFLRDWRRDEPTNMDPRLFDVVWEAYRGAGAGNQVINVVSAYRSPETNAMLRSRSRAVAKYSQHMLGKAMDTTMPGMPMSQIREIGMRMQRGGVGYYPTANTPFVHLDVGNVRSWPRMSYDQLMRLFPDGKTVHLPTNGQPLPGYELARAEIEARGDGAFVTAPRNPFGGFFAMLFGGGGEEDDSEVAAPAPSSRKQWGLAARKRRGAANDADSGEEGGGETPNTRAQAEIARAQADLPRGETTLSAPGEPPAADAAAPEQNSEAAPEDSHARKYVRAPLPPRGRPAALASIENTEEPQSPADSGEETSSNPMVKTPSPPRRPSMLVATISEAPPRGGRGTSSKIPDTKDNGAKTQTDLAPPPLDASGFARSNAASVRGKSVAATTTAAKAKLTTETATKNSSATKSTQMSKTSKKDASSTSSSRNVKRKN
jgi:uncharacterized protein YcbK (DUF882 family)